VGDRTDAIAGGRPVGVLRLHGDPSALAVPPRIHPLLTGPFSEPHLDALRHDVADLAAGYLPGEPARSAFVLAVHEITVNAVRHGGGSGRLWIWRDRHHLWCRVTDAGPGIPHECLPTDRQGTPRTVGGWGLWLLCQLCAELHICTGPTGTTIVIAHPVEARFPGAGSIREAEPDTGTAPDTSTARTPRRRP
jgi:serine/threonine-protein kinase RsbW